MLHIYYGDGKGKTSCAVGTAVRAAGRGLHVLFLQFLKSENSGERAVMKNLSNITLPHLPTSTPFSHVMNNTEALTAKEFCKQTFDLAIQSLSLYDMIVLDELFSAIDTGFLSEDDVLHLIKTCPQTTELVITGHKVSEIFLNLGDYVSHIEKIRHPYDKGITAREGIEY